MGKGNKKSKSQKKKNASSQQQQEWMEEVDPSVIRFQHARIRPFFSGCGRSVTETLKEASENIEIAKQKIPPIQTLFIDGEYYSLNNRRLWVWKECQSKGLVQKIRVRVRNPKSEAERQRYTTTNCALTAKFMYEKQQLNKEDQLEDDMKQITPTEIKVSEPNQPEKLDEHENNITEAKKQSKIPQSVIKKVDGNEKELYLPNDEEIEELQNQTKTISLYQNAFSGFETDDDSCSSSS